MEGKEGKREGEGRRKNNQNCCQQLRHHILRLKSTKFDFGWGSAPDPTGAAHSAPSDPLAGFKGSYL